MQFIPRAYQQHALNFVARNPYSALLADPGTGKTAIMLALIKWLRAQDPRRRILVMSSIRVLTDAWPGEIEKWDQFKGLTHALIRGTDKVDTLCTAVHNDVDIYMLNVDGLVWAQCVGILALFDTLIIDESSLVKGWMSKRMGALKKSIGGFKRRHIMTGSPTPNSLADYFAQQYIVDAGDSLGNGITRFRQTYLYDAAPPSAQYQKWVALPGSVDAVLKLVSRYACRLDGEALLDLPDLVENDIRVSLPESVLDGYRREIKDADSSGAAYALARRLSGGLYADGSLFYSAKLDRLSDIIEELSGSPVIVYFTHRVEGEAISERYKCPLVYQGVKNDEIADIFKKWNAGELPVVALSPAMCSHGLNLQFGGHHIVWFTLPTNADVYYQANRRLRRSGQQNGKVFVHRLVSPGTIDDALVELLRGKIDAQQKFLDGILSRDA